VHSSAMAAGEVCGGSDGDGYKGSGLSKHGDGRRLLELEKKTMGTRRH
jgi:hypothetical protein